MFKNYFKTAWRSITRNKTSTVINVLGLAIGISASLIIFMVVDYDYSFDKHEPGKERIYRVVTDGDGWKNEGVPVPLFRSLQLKASGIESTAEIMKYNEWHLKISIPRSNTLAPQIFKKQEEVVFANNNYFSIFPHTWLAGNATTSLQNPSAVVLSESRAKQYFPGATPDQLIGRIIVFSDTLQATITGIVKDTRENSDFEYKVFIALSTIQSSGLKENYSWDEWGNTNSSFQTIIKLLPGVQPAQVNKQIEAIFKENKSKFEYEKTTVHRLQPLSDVHTNTEFNGTVNISTIRNLVLLAVFLLLLGAINFINLSTAQSSQRAKEIGIRKTLGSKKQQLVYQFLSETFLLTLFASILSIAITPVLLRAFSGFIPEGLQLNKMFGQLSVWGFLLLLVVVVSAAAGLYPAIILTKFKPVTVLKNSTTSSGTTRSGWLRKSLIVFQFVIAQVFVIGMLVVYKQINYSIEKDMGFRKEAVVNFYVPSDFLKPDQRKFVLKDVLSKIPEIQQVGLGNQSPAFNGSMSSNITVKEKGKETVINVDTRNGDTSFLGVYNIKLLAGRNIMPADSATELLINETLAKQLGFKQPAAAIGYFVTFNGSSMPVVGVMADFHLASVRSNINPLIYYADARYGYVMHVALQNNPATWKRAIEKMEAAWKSLYPDTDFEYSFLDKKISDFYEQDKKLSMLLTWSAGVAIFISCLGLLGLVIFMTNTRTKEIGVRKILGASVTQIITLLSKDFARLIALAFLIAVPIAWWLGYNWLQDFAYHTDMNWWIFLLSGAFMLIIALAILWIKAGRAAMVNPVKSLRTE